MASTAHTRNRLATDAPIDYIDSDEFEDLAFSKSEVDLIEQLMSELSSNPRTGIDSAIGILLEKSLAPLTSQEEQILFKRMNYTRFQAEAFRSTLSLNRPSRRKLEKIEALLVEADSICRRIVESNLRLVASIARKYSSSAQDFQEYVSDGLMILLRAIRKFDYSRGFRFSTYATHSVQRHYFRASKRQQKYSQQFVLTPGEMMAGIVPVVDEDQVIDAVENPNRIYARLMEAADGRLNERETNILNRRFGTGGRGMTQTLREIAADMGISKERVRQIQLAALEKLKEVAAEANLVPTI